MKLEEQGLKDMPSHRVVLTGGGSQLPGIREVATMVLDKEVRVWKPKADINQPEVFTNPAYSTCVGLLMYALNYTEKRPNKIINKPVRSVGGLGKIFSWIKQNF